MCNFYDNSFGNFCNFSRCFSATSATFQSRPKTFCVCRIAANYTRVKFREREALVKYCQWTSGDWDWFRVQSLKFKVQSSEFRVAGVVVCCWEIGNWDWIVDIDTTEDRRQRTGLEGALRSTATILCPLSFVLCP